MPPPITVVLDRLPVSKSNYTKARAFVDKAGHARAQFYTGSPARVFQEEVVAALAPYTGIVFLPYARLTIRVNFNALTKAGKPRKTWPDPDGCFKAIADAIQQVGLVPNDRTILSHTIDYYPSTFDRLQITLEGLER